MNSQLYTLISILAYTGAAFAIGLRLFNPWPQIKPPRWLGIGLGFCGLMVHGLLLFDTTLSAAGLNLGFFSATSVLGWTMVLILMGSAVTKPIENLGIFVLPLAAICVWLDQSYPTINLISPTAPTGLKLHVLLSLLAYALLAMASVQAILLKIQDQHLHNRHPGGFIRALPPLQTMESLLFEMITLGFLLLSVSLLTGFLFLENLFAQHLAHKTLFALIGWVTFGALLWGRMRFGWRGKKAIRWTLTGFGALMLAYFGSKLVLELLLV